MQSDYILIFQTFVPCLDSPMYLPSKEGYEKITGDIGWYVHSETTFRQHHLSGVTGSTIFTWAKWGHIKSCFSWIMQRTWCTADAVCMRAVNTWSAVWAENPRWTLPAADTKPAGTELTFLLLWTTQPSSPQFSTSYYKPSVFLTKYYGQLKLHLFDCQMMMLFLQDPTRVSNSSVPAKQETEHFLPLPRFLRSCQPQCSGTFESQFNSCAGQRGIPARQRGSSFTPILHIETIYAGLQT